MIVSDALLAPTSPPDTGASRYSQASALMRAANSLVAIGEMELMSTTVLPGDSPAATPLGPNSTASTSVVAGTIVMTTSLRAATSFPSAHAMPPAATSSDGTPEREWR